jgi:uncharacterized membrane protein YdcZ (DUF606 family)
MKKISLTILALAAVAGVSFGQGYVAWQNSPAGNIIGVTNSTTYSPLFGGGATGNGASGVTVAGGSSLFYYALLVNTSSSAVATPTTASSLQANWAFTGLLMTNGSTANGRLSEYNPASAALGDPSYVSGTANFLIVGWSSNIAGTNYATVISDLNNWNTVGGTITGNAYFGISTEATLTLSTSSSVGTTLWGVGAGQINNPSSAPLELYLLPVPEPGTMALAALGGASLLLFRRRK